MPPDVDENEYNKKYVGGEKLREILRYGRPFGNNPSLGGGKGCIRACMIHLEKEGRIKNIFKNPFRKRKPWLLK